MVCIHCICRNDDDGWDLTQHLKDEEEAEEEKKKEDEHEDEDEIASEDDDERSGRASLQSGITIKVPQAIRVGLNPTPNR